MKAYLSRRYRISASHRLHSEALTAEENRSVYGKCNNLYGHGHNYTIEVTVGGDVDEVTGMICNLADLDRCVEREVIARFDHANLNLANDFSDRVPTTENLSETIYRLLSEHFVAARVERVRIEETANNSFEVAGKRQYGSSNCS